MFNLFASRKNSDVEVLKSAKSLLARMSQVIGTRQDALDALGDEHGDVDLRLTQMIERVLSPLIGPSESDEAGWFQSMDYHGDGIRHLEFKPGQFPMIAVPALQSLLVDEYASFCILCWAPLEPDVAPEQEQGIVIFSDTILLTPRLAAAGVSVPSTVVGTGV